MDSEVTRQHEVQLQHKTRISRTTGPEGKPEKKEAEVAGLVEWLASVGESALEAVSH